MWNYNRDIKNMTRNLYQKGSNQPPLQQGTPYGPNTQGYPVYNPYLNPDRTLRPEARVQFQKVSAPDGANLLNQFDANQSLAASRLQQGMAEQGAANSANLLSRGVSQELFGRLQNDRNQQNNRNLIDFYAQGASNRYGVQDAISTRNWQNDMYNTTNDLTAQRANIQTMIDENRYGTESDLSRYGIEKQLQAAQEQAAAMRAQARKSGGGILSKILSPLGGLF